MFSQQRKKLEDAIFLPFRNVKGGIFAKNVVSDGQSIDSSEKES